MAFFQFVGAAGAKAFKDGVESVRLEFVDMMGMGYVMDHCISHFLKSQEKQAYRVYITEALKLLTENTAKYSGGSYMTKSFSDIYKKEEKKEKKETAEDIKKRIKSKFK